MKSKGLIAAVAGTLVVGGIAFAAVRYVFRSSEDSAIELVPADSFAYGNVFLRPSNGQRLAIEDILAAAGQDPEETTNALTDLLDRGLKECDATFEDDVDPYLGDQAAFFVSTPEDLEEEEPDGALIVDTSDEEGARDLIDKCLDAQDIDAEPEERTYKGFTYDFYEKEDAAAVGFVDNFMVAGTEKGFKAAVDTAEDGDSLATSDKYREVRATVNDDNLAFVYFDFKPFMELQEESGEVTEEDRRSLQLFRGAFEKPYAFSVFATSQGLVLESAGPWPGEGPLAPILDVFEAETHLEELPEDAWLAFGIPEIGSLAGAVYEAAVEINPQEAQSGIEDFEEASGLSFDTHIVEGMRGGRVFVGNGIGPATRGALILETINQDVATDIVDAFRTLAEQEGTPPLPLTLEGYEQGLTIVDPDSPEPVHVVVDGARIVGGFGDEATLAALEGDQKLADSQAFKDARELLGDGYEPFLFVDLNVVVNAFDAFVAPAIPDYPEDSVEPITDALSHLTVGTKRDGDYVLQRMVIGAEQEDR